MNFFYLFGLILSIIFGILSLVKGIILTFRFFKKKLSQRKEDNL